MKVAVLGFIYSEAMMYFEDYLYTISIQSYNKFDLIIVNDGVKEDRLKDIFLKYPGVNIKLLNLNAKLSIAKIREFGINYALNSYDYIVFTDCDDFFERHRVELSMDYLNKYDFCYNDMILVNEKGVSLQGNTFFFNKGNPKYPNKLNHVLDANFFGLSNSAIKCNKIKPDFFFIPEDTIAVDWWIVTKIIISGLGGIYLDSPLTFYRQHSRNIIGANPLESNTYIDKLMHVSKNHYHNILKICNNENYLIVKKKYDEILRVETLLNDNNIRNYFIEQIENKIHNLLWWEGVNIVNEMGIIK